MKTPFTIEQFLEVFKNYNTAVFPMQLLFYLWAGIVIYLLIKPVYPPGKIIAAILAFCWLWMGIIYHLVFFSAINKAAYFFGAAFMVEGIFFLVYGIIKNKLSFHYRGDIYGVTGLLMVLFALVIYPAWGYAVGHQYPYAPTFGLPCPTTIFSLGILLLSDKKIHPLLLIIPFAWSLTGFTATFLFGMVEDISLLISGVVTLVMVIMKNKKYKTVVTSLNSEHALTIKYHH